MITCPNCRHSNPDGSANCEACYTPLPIQQACPECGATIVEPEAPFCDTCGCALPPPVPPVSDTAVNNSAPSTAIPNDPPVPPTLRRIPKKIHIPRFRCTGLKRLLTWIGAIALRFKPQPIEQTAPFIRDLSQYKFGIPLKSTFRFAHEPIHAASSMAFIGRQAELNTLVERILFSNGGSFLVTGYRGVGKTSFVNQVIKTLEAALPWAETYLGKTEVLAVQLNLARPLQPSELMHHIIRRLYHKLLDKGIFSALDPDLQEQLTLAYRRTSVTITRSTADGRESNIGLSEFSIGEGDAKATFKPSLSYKRTQTQNYQSVFLGYDDKAAEYDVIDLSRRLVAGYAKKRPFWGRMRASSHRKYVRLKIIFVFDEMDKLEEFFIENNGEKQLFIDSLLSHLKNLFTTSGISFIFIAGKDLHERWLEDLGKGDSIYESVFSYDKYLPCMWTNVNEICDLLVDRAALIDNSIRSKSECFRCHAPTFTKQMFCSQCGAYLLDSNEARFMFEDFKKYLGYKGRGLPRRIIRGFNEYVQWNDQRPTLVFAHQDIRRIRFYAELQAVLEKTLPKLLGTATEEFFSSQQDKQRLGIYYLIDWILRRGTRSFTLSDAIHASEQLSKKVALAEEVAPQILGDIIDVLVKHEYLQEVKKELNQAQIIELNAKGEKQYQILPRRLNEITGVADIFAEEAYVLNQDETNPTQIGNYKLQEKIGMGGMGTVYRAWDRQNNREVALKLLDRNLVSASQLAKRFRREAEILRRLDHPNIVRYYDSGEIQGQFYLAMNYVDGPNLGVVLEKYGKLDAEIAIHLIQPFAEALQYVHEQGFIRNDIKPGNILLSRDGEVYLADLGITKSKQGDMNVTGVVAQIGTPQYMAPEQWENKPADERSDIYSLGITLYEMVTGRRPFEGYSIEEIEQQHLNQTLLSPSNLTPLPPTLEQMIVKCLARQPEQRFQTMKEVVMALKAIPTQAVDRRSLVAMITTTLAKIQQDQNSARISTMIGFPSCEVPIVAIAPIDALPVPAAVASPAPSIPDFAPFPATGEFSPISIEPASGKESALFQVSPARAVYPLTQTAIRLGRDRDNEIRLDNRKISRFHARILRQNDRYYLEDLNSSRGTIVNGASIRGQYELQNHDRIQIANFEFEFRTGVSLDDAETP